MEAGRPGCPGQRVCGDVTRPCHRLRSRIAAGVPASLLFCAAIGIACPPPAGAGAQGSDGGGSVSVGASGGDTAPGSSGSTTGGGAPGRGTGGSWVCTDTALTLNDRSQLPGGPLPGGWFSVTCVDLATGAMSTVTEWISQASPGAGVSMVDPYMLAMDAERSIQLPNPQIDFSPSGPAVVNLPTWLWVGASLWHSFTVSASAAGVTTTAVAMPRSVSWKMGDGSDIVCNGPGTPYNSSMSEAAQTPTCAYTYQRSSAGQPSPDGDPNDGSYSVTATVEWTVSWSATGAPGGGPLPDLETSSTASLRVEQVESVNLAPPPVGLGASG